MQPKSPNASSEYGDSVQPRKNQKSSKSARTWLLASVKVAVSVALLVLLARSMDTDAVVDVLRDLPFSAVATAGGLLIALTLLLGLRWWIVLDAIRTPLRLGQAVSFTFFGVFFNQVLPTSFGGDAIRMWEASRAGIHAETAITGVLLDRICGVLGLVVLSALGVWYMGANMDNQALRLGLVAILPIALLGIAVLASLDRVPSAWRELPVLRNLARLAVHGRLVFFAPGTALTLLLLSLLGHALSSAAVYAFAAGLDLQVSFWDCLALFPCVILATMIPITFAGWGLREGAMVVLFGFVGVNADTALALSLAYGFVILIASLPGCVLWLAARRVPRAGVTP